MTLACKDANSKLVDVVTVSVVDVEERVGNSLVVILMLKIVSRWGRRGSELANSLSDRHRGNSRLEVALQVAYE